MGKWNDKATGQTGALYHMSFFNKAANIRTSVPTITESDLNVNSEPSSNIVSTSSFVNGKSNLYLCVSNAGTTNACTVQQT